MEWKIYGRVHLKGLYLSSKKKLNLTFQAAVMVGKYLGSIVHKETLKSWYFASTRPSSPKLASWAAPCHYLWYHKIRVLENWEWLTFYVRLYLACSFWVQLPIRTVRSLHLQKDNSPKLGTYSSQCKYCTLKDRVKPTKRKTQRCISDEL